MSIAAKLWQINQDLVQACLDHPFVRGIGDGQLPKANFAYYVGQDAFFLEAFARAYSVAAAKMPDWQGFQILHELAGGVLAELHLHQSYAQQWEVDLRTVIPGAATRRYTDFLLATAWSQSVGITIAAMLPCMRLYAFLGQSLAENGIPEHPYSDWIRTYSSDQFEPLAHQLADLADRYTPDGDEPMHSIVQATYRYAMQCELDFFEAAWQHEACQI